MRAEQTEPQRYDYEIGMHSLFRIAIKRLFSTVVPVVVLVIHSLLSTSSSNYIYMTCFLPLEQLIKAAVLFLKALLTATEQVP